MRWKCKAIEYQNQRDGDGERGAGKDSRTSQPCTQSQPLPQLRNIGVELVMIAHSSSRWMPMWPLANRTSANATTIANSITYHHKPTGRYFTSAAGTPGVGGALPGSPIHSCCTSSPSGCRS